MKIFFSTIGYKVRVVWSPNPTQIGIEGRVIDDTFNTLVIMKNNGEIIRIGKKGCVFEFIKDSDKVMRISGNDLIGDYIRRLSKI